MSVVQYYPGYDQVQVHENLIIQTIASITQAFPAILTTVNDHNYVAGMNVSFLIPTQFGMVELNNQNVQVLEVTSNTLTLNVDTRNYTAFAYPSPLPSAYTPPSVVPNSSGPYLPPLPLPNGNQTSFEGAIYNAGAF
jgi:hypothetical protein